MTDRPEPTEKMQTAYLELAMEQLAAIRSRNDAKSWRLEHEEGYKRDLRPSQWRQVEKRLEHVEKRVPGRKR